MSRDKMKLNPFRTFLALAVATSAVMLPAIAASSCGSSAQPTGFANQSTSSSGSSSGSSGSTSSGGSSGSGSSGGGGDEMDATLGLVTYDGPPPNVDGGHLLCATPDGLPIKFNPMYSGFDGVHMYQVPSFVEGVDPSSITWGSSDPTMVDMQPYVTGIMITTKKAGDVTIVARSGSMCGSAPLHITQFAADEWTTGNSRYNNGGALNVCFDASGIYDVNVPDGFDGNISGFDASGYLGGDGGNCMNLPAGLTNPFECTPPPACTNCHGSVGNGTLFGMNLFSNVSHTPEQTGGFSDTDLVNVFVHGTVPAGGYFDDSIICYSNWHQVHTWTDISTTAEQNGMVSYLRSLTPKQQLGCFDLLASPHCADGG
jgi:hypothetical protein